MLGEHSCLLELRLRDDSFNVSLSSREQCYSTRRILRTEYDPSGSFALIGKRFRVDRGTI
jgi:hypothetical protein